MKKTMTLLALLLGLVFSAGADVIAKWNFENATKRALVTATSPIANYGTFDEGIGIGEISSTVGPAPLVSAWSSQTTAPNNLFNFSHQKWDAGSGTKYWQVKVSTAGFESIHLSSLQKSSDTGPRDFKIQYSTDGTSFTDAGIVITVRNDAFISGVLASQLLPVACANQATLYLRWIMTSNVAAKVITPENTVASGGTSRIDEIIVSGTPIPPPPIQITATSATTSGSYATLKAAFDAINAGTHQGEVAISLIGNTTETSSASLNASGDGSASYTSISIKPDASNRTITGDVAGALINLNGADFVTIDGLSRKLSITNTYSTGTAIQIGTGSDNNTITGCAVTATTGVYSGNASTIKISKNKIHNIGNYSGVPVYGIVIDGTNNISVENNMISLQPSGTLTELSGIDIKDLVPTNNVNAYVYYNTVYLGGSATSPSSAFSVTSNSVLTAKNNIFYNARTSSTDYSVSNYALLTNVTQDYNLLYSTGTNLATTGTDYLNLTGWKATNLDANSQSGNLVFEDHTTGDLSYKRETINSTVFDKGTPITGINDDYLNKSRTSLFYSQVDIGAYELPQSSDLSETILPTVNTLAQNYPNPFNPETTIGFTLAKNATVNLTVYNTKGEMVKALINNNLNAGFHNVNFNAVGLNSGVYVYKLTTPDNSITKKMILLK